MHLEKKRVLIVDDDQNLREVLLELLSAHGYLVDCAENGQKALEQIQALARDRPYDHILTDINMPVMDGLTFLEKLGEKGIETRVTVISAHSEMANVVKAITLGASDFIAKPFQSEEEILFTLKKVEEQERLQHENKRLRQELEQRYTFANIVAQSTQMLAMFETISKIADYKTTILISGESGTGKELVARAIHYNSRRKNQPLISINCGGIPESLLESELFGHVRGAFTDAVRDKKGLFEEADGGTLFLDEIGELPVTLQVKLLRALQEEEIRPLGSTRAAKVDVRIITATARNLRQEVEAKRFREDLFYRINVLSLEIPPLRRRKEDIPLLIDHFIKKYNQRLGLAIEKADQGFLQWTLRYSWPGNVRELENIIERSMALSTGKILSVRDLPQELFLTAMPAENLLEPQSFSIKENTRNLEKNLIEKALACTGGNKSKAARLLEISLPALHYKIKGYSLNEP